jgi:peptidyl-prolyl cis-trans isomerase A (cyclophilin A)
MSLFSRIRTLAAIASLGWVAMFADLASATIVRFQTTLGNIDIRLYDSATPLHAANLLNYVNSNRYDGTFIHRSAKSGPEDFVIQGGGYRILSSLLAEPLESGWQRIPSFGFVTNEPGISNLRGTIALAKGSGESSGSSEWFINLNDDNVFLDQGPPVSNRFTVFGRVVGNGMTVADAIADLARVNVSVGSNPCVRNCAFREVPVLDLAKVQMQQDVRNDDVVRMVDSIVLNIPAGDYDFNGVANSLDYGVWRRTFGSRRAAEADGNGNGIVDTADYVVWRKSRAGGAGASLTTPIAAPEPSALSMTAAAGLLFLGTRRRSWRS